MKYKKAMLLELKTLVLVDEDDVRRQRLSRTLESLSAAVRPAGSMIQALEYLAEDPQPVLLVARFARLDGAAVRLLEKLKQAQPSLSILALTAGRVENSALKLLQAGTLDGIASPADPGGILSIVRSELRRMESEAQADRSAKSLRRLKAEQARDHKRTMELEEIYDSTLENLMTALDLRDVETFGHSRTVAKYTQVLAALMGFKSDEELDNLRKGALLHDIGKIAIPDSILKKPRALLPDEWEKIKLHPALGYGLIKEIKLVKIIGNIILHHHERFDGGGYPHGLKQDKIPLEARIFALADALDAITAHRPYRRALDFKSAESEIIKNSGTQFDPDIVDIFLSLKPEQWAKIRFETTSHFPGIADFSALLRKVRAGSPA